MESTGYPFLDYINEDKSHYIHAKDFKIDINNPKANSHTVEDSYWNTHEYRTYVDDDDLFLVGESGGFLMNIRPGYKFVNTELFYEVADYYRKNKVFTTYKEDSIPHRQFRRREQYRRANGYSAPCLLCPDGSIRNVRITGDHYNFLNYTRIEQLDERSIKRGNVDTASKTYDFPKFFDAQFWMYHVLEFAKNNGFHILIDKTRRGGFSYMMASTSANAVNVQPRKVVINVAVDKKYLTMTGGLTDFAINGLKFYEEKSPFKRGIISTVKENFKLGYKLPNGVEADNSWRSSLLSVSAKNNPDCAIGKDALIVNVEEVSTMENFNEFMEVTEPAMRTGAYTTGMLRAWGTSTSGNMQTFEENFYNPKAYNFMPFENVWDKDARGEICGFFKPYCWALQGEINGVKGVDKYGNSNLLIGLEIAKRERAIKKANCKTYSEYINYLGQYANFPSESFSSTSENLFSSEELSEWENRLRIDTDLHFYVDGQLEEDATGRINFISNKQLLLKGQKVYDYIQGVPRKGHEDPHGCIRRWFPPEYTETRDAYGRIIKEIPKGLYSITYDPVGVDKDKKEITNKHSHNSIKVWMNPHYLNGFKQKLVCVYYGRPDTLEEADRICYLLAKYYNCIGTTNVEVNRGETISNFKKWKALNYLSSEPLHVWDASFKGKINNTYGYSIGNDAKKLNGLRLLKEFLYEEIGRDENDNPVRNYHRIYDYQTILELKKWNIEGNYDRVSEMILRGIEWKAMSLDAEDELSRRQKITDRNIDEFSDSIMERDWF